VRAEFGPPLPVLLRGRGRWVAPLALGALVALVGLLVAVRAASSEDAPTTLVHEEPDFTMLVSKDDLRRVAPRGREYVRLEGRGRFTTVSVSVAPLPRPPARTAPTLVDLPIESERIMDDLRRRRDGFVLLDEGRARVNDAPGYQLRHRSGPESAPRFGHDVLLVPEPPADGAGVLVSLDQRNERRRLGPGDRRIAYAAKRAFRSVRFGIKRP
jgi:hypothetical protein